ncbi:HAMP domain-containing protein [Tranquillimonas rosea]|uniref:HAMP domain-containing protein n=1 Tax=Tranquillimonas rosea TaxID=641238 RepID=A0A1H9PM77_9RHOB|nr:cache domain-containing protein [Tranquillimonas rosea]SER48899.1 HAMP domain-containing protein [Tranquillimonas rosea]
MSFLKREYQYQPSLRRSLVGFMAVACVTAMISLVLGVRHYASDFERSVQANLVQRGTESVRMTFANAMAREWESLEAVAENVNLGSREQMTSFVDAVVEASNRIAWAGVADLSGHVLAGSNGYREGEDVGGRRWFREGLKTPSFGNVFSLDRAGGEDRYLNMSVPIKGPDLIVDGVMVYRVKVDWIEEYLTTAARDLGLDFFVLNSAGEIVIDGDLSGFGPLSENIALAATIASERRFMRATADGAYLVGIHTKLTADTMPRSGWTLAVRVPSTTPQGDVRDLTQVLLGFCGLVLMGMLLFSILFGQHFLRPIQKLAETARSIANGDDRYPEELDSTRESAAFSDALAMIQTRLSSK